MKYLTEYRDHQMVKEYLDEIERTTARPFTIMEVCGGQTHSLVKNGIIDNLPNNITMLHGPGCPVCVTPVGVIDEAYELCRKDNVILCSFGDMLRVPGSHASLLEIKASGGDVRIVYSPLDAVKLAKQHPDKEVVFFAVGFETTAPANALSVIQAEAEGVTNYSILTSHVLVPPAIEAILGDPDCKVNAFLAAGHVCTIMGTEEYDPIVEKYNVPIVITGFEPVDLLQGILMAVKQLEQGIAKVENQYTRMVQREGNRLAQQSISKVFDVADKNWRGLGTIPSSGYRVNSKYKSYDAHEKFKLTTTTIEEDDGCISGDIMKGKKKPMDCAYFGKQCTPLKPIGAPMVSTEGPCAAYYDHATTNA